MIVFQDFNRFVDDSFALREKFKKKYDRDDSITLTAAEQRLYTLYIFGRMDGITSVGPKREEAS